MMLYYRAAFENYSDAQNELENRYHITEFLGNV